MPIIDRDSTYSLLKISSPAEEWAYLKRYYAPHTFPAGKKIPFETTYFSILNFIKRRYSPSSVIIEDNYIDKDYRSEYSLLYCKTFKEYRSICKKLHFFKAKINSMSEISNTPANSLGYSACLVIRPVDIGIVGKTLIMPPIDKQKSIKSSPVAELQKDKL